MVKTGPKNEAPTAPVQLIYCGPNIPGGILRQYTVFKGCLPAHLNDMLEECPAVKRLCVPVANLAATRRTVGISGSAEFIAYGQVLEYTRKGGK